VTRERRADLVHEGGERFTAQTATGRSLVFGDEAAVNELSPVETIVTALAACSAMDVISIATKKRQAIDRYEVHAVGNQRDEYPQVLTEVTVTHEVWGANLSEAAIRRAIELSATKYCPVNAMVSAGATVVHHRYALHVTGPTSIDSEGEVVSTGPYRRPDVLGD
jgi:putative redox protein